MKQSKLTFGKLPSIRNTTPQTNTVNLTKAPAATTNTSIVNKLGFSRPLSASLQAMLKTPTATSSLASSSSSSSGNVKTEKKTTTNTNVKSTTIQKAVAAQKRKAVEKPITQTFNKKQKIMTTSSTTKQVVKAALKPKAKRPEPLPRSLKLCDPMTSMWVDVLRPQQLQQIVGNTNAVLSFKNWLRARREHEPHAATAAAIWGPPGTGKTSTVRLIAAQLGFQTREYNMSVTTTLSVMHEIQELMAAKRTSDSERPFVIICEESDGMDREPLSAAVKMLKELKLPNTAVAERKKSSAISAKKQKTIAQARALAWENRGITYSHQKFLSFVSRLNPVIFIFNDKRRKMDRLVKCCQTFLFQRLEESQLRIIANNALVAQKAQAKILPAQLTGLIRSCHGDARSLLMNIQFLTLGTDLGSEQLQLATHRSIFDKDAMRTAFELAQELAFPNHTNVLDLDRSIAAHRQDGFLRILLSENYPLALEGLSRRQGLLTNHPIWQLVPYSASTTTANTNMTKTARKIATDILDQMSECADDVSCADLFKPEDDVWEGIFGVHRVGNRMRKAWITNQPNLKMARVPRFKLPAKRTNNATTYRTFRTLSSGMPLSADVDSETRAVVRQGAVASTGLTRMDFWGLTSHFVPKVHLQAPKIPKVKSVRSQVRGIKPSPKSPKLTTTATIKAKTEEDVIADEITAALEKSAEEAEEELAGRTNFSFGTEEDEKRNGNEEEEGESEGEEEEEEISPLDRKGRGRKRKMTIKNTRVTTVATVMPNCCLWCNYTAYWSPAIRKKCGELLQKLK